MDRAETVLGENSVGRVVEKTRHCVPVGDTNWVVDAFLGKLAGLVWAEIELDSKDQPIVRPHWLGREISDDRRFRHSSLVVLSNGGAEAVSSGRILASNMPRPERATPRPLGDELGTGTRLRRGRPVCRVPLSKARGSRVDASALPKDASG